MHIMEDHAGNASHGSILTVGSTACAHDGGSRGDSTHSVFGAGPCGNPPGGTTC